MNGEIMNSWQKFSKFIKKFTLSTSEEERAAETERFQKRYQAFQKLLANNNSVLEMMADMEEKLSGEFLFDRPYIDTKVSAIKEGVRAIIDSVNVITQNQFTQLYDRLQLIEEQIDNTLYGKKEISEHPLTIPFHEMTKESVEQAGGKNAHLGELGNQAGLPVPDGFAVSAYAYKRFMEHNHLFEFIHEQLADIPIQNLERLKQTSQVIQTKVMAAHLPSDLEQAIEKACLSLSQKSSNNQLKVSVRSSALKEDSEFSFAGQYATFLNTPLSSITEKYKAVVASLFTPSAIFYYKTRGFQEYDMVMAVGVVQMIDAAAAGVMYSRDPNDPKNSAVIISAVHGLGIPVVDGSVTPETYRVYRESGRIEVEKKWPDQKTMFVCPSENEPEEIPLPESLIENPCLQIDTIRQLACYAMDIEKYYNNPQDIEWAVDKHNRIFILQARPLALNLDMTAKPVPPRVPGYNIMLDKGIIACKGIGFGKAFVVKEERSLEDFPDGAVLVVRNTSIRFVPFLSRASAIVTDVGGVASHMASIAREFHVPAIFDTETSTSIIKDGQDITVDAINCNIYDGTVSELEELAARQEDPFKSTHLFRTLEQVQKKISPLSLLNSAAANFKPEHCQTLHDITRYCHEISMHHMFAITDTSFKEISGAVKLFAGIPTQVFVIDLGGGFDQKQRKKLMPEHINSVPFSALLKGLVSMKWPEPRAFDAKGFLGMVAHTAAIQEHELVKMGQQSFAFISESYMNFSIRLGYHLSTIEAYADENLNSNYIKFFFKGGGAATDRRLRRVRLIVEVLRKLDFEVKIKEDVIEAAITKYKKKVIENRLEILGKLTAYTKQLDMVMYSDDVTNWYVQEFISEHIDLE